MVIKILRSMTDDVKALPFISYLSLISAVIVPSFFVQTFDVHPIYSAVFFPAVGFWTNLGQKNRQISDPPCFFTAMGGGGFLSFSAAEGVYDSCSFHYDYLYLLYHSPMFKADCLLYAFFLSGIPDTIYVVEPLTAVSGRISHCLRMLLVDTNRPLTFM